MSNVVGLDGNVPMVARQPSERLVETLRDLLRRAEDGDIQAASVAFVDGDGCASWVNSGRLGSYSLIGAGMAATHSLLALAAQSDTVTTS